MDEALTYFRACNESSDFYEELYSTADDPSDLFRRLFSVDEPFRYDIVYRNETENVHPPLYYYLLHTICSLFPGRFSLYFAGAINALFAVGTLLALHGIMRLLVNDERTRGVLCLLYVLSPAVWNSLSYLRMYVMLGFWITSLAWLFIANERVPVRHYRLWLFLVVYCGLLTHHHFILYLAGASLTYLVLLTLRRDRKTILDHLWIVLAGCLCAFASFPPMVNQILNSDRGNEAQQNIMNLRGFVPRIRWFVENGGQELFGQSFRLAIPLGIICLLVVVVSRLGKGSQGEHATPSMQDLCLLIIPTGLHLAIVAISASFLMTRYVYAIYPLCLAIMGILLHEAALSAPHLRRLALPPVVVASAIATVSAFHAAMFPYLYQGDAEKREALVAYSEVDCLYLIRQEGMYASLIADYPELSMYRSLTAIDAFDPNTLVPASSDCHQLIVVTDENYYYQSEDMQGEIEEFCVRNGLPSQVTDLGKFSSDTHTFLCSEEGSWTQ